MATAVCDGGNRQDARAFPHTDTPETEETNVKTNRFLKKLLLCALSTGLLLAGCSGGAGDTDTGTGTGKTTDSGTEPETKKPEVTTPGGQVNREDIINSYKYKNPWKTGITVKGADGKEISLREVTIDIPGDGTPIEIFQISDVHFNALYEDEADFVKASYKEWGANFGDNETIINTFSRCLNYASGADRIIVTGDIVNFYSRANYDVMEKYVFRAAENINAALTGKVIPTPGNHECTYPDRRSLAQFEKNYAELKALYGKYGLDMDYTSQVIDGRVMVVVLDNASRYDALAERYSEKQLDNLAQDIARARENGYTMLLFGHIPMPTKNTDGSGFYIDYDADAYANDRPNAKAFYELVTNNADVIRGYFTGHNHGDTYVEIVAKTGDGKPAFIPQYVIANMSRQSGSAESGGNGNMTRIVLK